MFPSRIAVSRVIRHFILKSRRDPVWESVFVLRGRVRSNSDHVFTVMGHGRDTGLSRVGPR
jgi:hypothetical protein